MPSGMLWPLAMSQKLLFVKMIHGSILSQWSTHHDVLSPNATPRIVKTLKSLASALAPNYDLSTSNYLASAHVDGDRLNPMVNQRSANVAGTAIKTMPTVTETADANG